LRLLRRRLSDEVFRRIRSDEIQIARTSMQKEVVAGFVETVFLKTLYVLVFLHIQTRRILGVGVSANPDGTWVSQQARNLVMDVKDETEIRRMRFLLRDRDAKYCRTSMRSSPPRASRSR
jgi:hypothetical protein